MLAQHGGDMGRAAVDQKTSRYRFDDIVVTQKLELCQHQ